MHVFHNKQSIKHFIEEVGANNETQPPEIDRINSGIQDKAIDGIERVSRYKYPFQAAVFYNRLRSKTDNIFDLVPPKYLCLHIAVSLANIEPAKEKYLKYFDKKKHGAYSISEFKEFHNVPLKNNKAAKDLYRLFLHTYVSRFIGIGLDLEDDIFIDTLASDFAISQNKHPYAQYSTQAYGLSDCVGAYVFLLREDFDKYETVYTKDRPAKLYFSFPLASFYSNLPTLKYPRRYFIKCGPYGDFIKKYAIDLANEYPDAAALAVKNKDRLVYFLESLFLSEGLSINSTAAYIIDDATRLFASMASLSVAFGICDDGALTRGKGTDERREATYELASQFYSLAIAMISIIKSIKGERLDFYKCSEQTEGIRQNTDGQDNLRTQINVIENNLSICRAENAQLRENMKNTAATKAGLNKSVKDKDAEISKLRLSLNEANGMIALYESSVKSGESISADVIPADKDMRIAIIGGNKNFHLAVTRLLKMAGYENVSAIDGKDRNFNAQNIKDSDLLVIVTQWVEHSVINRVKKCVGDNKGQILYTTRTNTSEILKAIEDRLAPIGGESWQTSASAEEPTKAGAAPGNAALNDRSERTD